MRRPRARTAPRDTTSSTRQGSGAADAGLTAKPVARATTTPRGPGQVLLSVPVGRRIRGGNVHRLPRGHLPARQQLHAVPQRLLHGHARRSQLRQMPGGVLWPPAAVQRRNCARARRQVRDSHKQQPRTGDACSAPAGYSNSLALSGSSSSTTTATRVPGAAEPVGFARDVSLQELRRRQVRNRAGFRSAARCDPSPRRARFADGGRGCVSRAQCAPGFVQEKDGETFCLPASRTTWTRRRAPPPAGLPPATEMTSQRGARSVEARRERRGLLPRSSARPWVVRGRFILRRRSCAATGVRARHI